MIVTIYYTGADPIIARLDVSKMTGMSPAEVHDMMTVIAQRERPGLDFNFNREELDDVQAEIFRRRIGDSPAGAEKLRLMREHGLL